MKRFLLLPACALVLFSASTTMINSTGIAGYSGAGGGQTCNSCHGGGGGSGSTTITTVPSFSNGLYKPDSVYQVNIQVQASGYSKYGFDCEILDSVFQDAGRISPTLTAAGVKTLNFSGRHNATHTTPRNGSTGVTFSFAWKAPSSGRATIFVAANAVNGNNSTSGDHPLAPVSLFAYPEIAPVDTSSNPEDSLTVGFKETVPSIADFEIYPNPARIFTSVTYALKSEALTQIAIYDLKGQEIKRFNKKASFSGSNKDVINVADLPEGAYFVALGSNNVEIARKLVIIY